MRNIVIRTSMKQLPLLIPKLRSGDLILLMGATNEARNDAIKMVPPGVKVEITYQYSSLSRLVPALLTLPAGVGVIDYDYEHGPLCPEFTLDEKTSIEHFDMAETTVKAYNVRTNGTAILQVDPPGGEFYHAHWDWHLASEHIPMMNVQMQAFTTNPVRSLELIKTLADNKVNGLSIEISTAQMQQGAGTPQQNAYIFENADPRITMFFIHHGSDSHNNQLMEFLNLIRP